MVVVCAAFRAGRAHSLPPCLLSQCRLYVYPLLREKLCFHWLLFTLFMRLLPVYWKGLIGLQSDLSCSQNCTLVLFLLFLWSPGAKPPSPPCPQAVQRLVVHLWNGNGHLSSPQPPLPSSMWGFTRMEKVSASPPELCSQLRVRICPK